MKKLITALLVPILCLTINMNVFASPATTPTSNPDELLNELNQEMEEINHHKEPNCSLYNSFIYWKNSRIFYPKNQMPTIPYYYS